MLKRLLRAVSRVALATACGAVYALIMGFDVLEYCLIALLIAVLATIAIETSDIAVLEIHKENGRPVGEILESYDKHIATYLFSKFSIDFFEIMLKYGVLYGLYLKSVQTEGLGTDSFYYKITLVLIALAYVPSLKLLETIVGKNAGKRTPKIFTGENNK